MRSKSRRYEVLLPVRFNDGSDVPAELLGQAIGELIQEFNAVSSYKEAIEGRWRHGETLYRDDLALLVVDVPDTAKNRKWMKAYKARWKNRLDEGVQGEMEEPARTTRTVDDQLSDRHRMNLRTIKTLD